MAILKVLVLSMACLYVTAVRLHPPAIRNTIFGDERLEGEIFEHVDEFQNITLYNDDNPYRLPQTTRPIHYIINWAIDITNLAYTGTVVIDLVATEANVNEIVLHSSHHNILTLSLAQGATTIAQTYSLEPDYHFLRIITTNPLTYNAVTPVVYRLTITFSATMRNDMYGIYGSWFRNNPTDTAVSWMATTQFQATAARFAFPCYDEPGFKATFDITIRRPNGYSSWSCTRISQTVENVVAGYSDDIYYTTPIMSTYLLAIIVAEYATMPVNGNDGRLIYEVIARPAAITAGQGQYAFDVGQELLDEMSDHTAIDFFSVNDNLKMTQAAIPDFGAGAMENWGLLTYREAYLMYDENHTSKYYQQLIAYILSHEIAHMWFGNLVTCDWWDVLWLNEGFARYYQYFLTHWIEDFMGFETRFITEQVHTALLSDSANNPHPLTNPGVGSPAAVSAMFSTLSYNKGAALIRMTEHLLGFDIHRQGLRNYLNNRRFSTALPIHLFNELQAVGVQSGALAEYPSDFSIVDYYQSWTEQRGVPVLNVEVNHRTGRMTITQRRFNINTGYSSVKTNWIVPITFATASNPDFNNTKPSHIIRDSLTIINRGTIGDEWVVFNKQQTGYYRVNYDDYTWNLITLALKSNDRTLIHQYNRAQIVNDVFQFARSGLMTYTRALNILSFLEFETEYAPWVAAMTGFSWIRNRLAGTEYLSQVEDLIARWATRVMSEVTYYPSTGDDFMRAYLRYQLAPVMCNMNVRACRIAANAQFTALRDNNIQVPVDNRLFVYCNALRDGTVEDFDYLFLRFTEHQVYTEKITLLQTLGCTPHEAALNRFLDAIIQDNFIIRPQDYSTALNSAATGNEVNTQIFFRYLQNNLASLSTSSISLTTAFSYVTSRLRSEDEVDEFQGWAWQNQAALGNSFQSIFNAAETSREAIRWAAATVSDFDNYLVNGNDPIETSTPAVEPPVEVVTEAQPALVEPESPDFSDIRDSSATSVTLSVFLVTLGVILNTLRV